MKAFLLPTLLGFFLIFQSNITTAQMDFSLDSIIIYDDNNILETKEFITEKDSDGYRLKTNIYRYNSGTNGVTGKREYTYHANKDTKLYRNFNCFPNKDTCIRTFETERNEYGELTTYIYKSLLADDEPGLFEITRNITYKDSIILDSEGRVLRSYNFKIDAIANEKILEERINYFFTPGNQRDSFHRFLFDGSDFVLDRRVHYTYTPSGKITSLLYIFDTRSELTEYQWEEVNGVEQIKYFSQYDITGIDTVLTFEETYAYDDFYTTSNYSSYFNGDINYGGKSEYFLLSDMITNDSSTVFFLDTNTGDYNKYNSRKFYYTNLSSTTNYAPSNEVILFPNPSQDFLRLKTSKNDFQFEQQYHILDASGKVKSSGDYFGNLIDISNLPSGNYHLLLETGIVKPFVIQR